jgi:membrane protease YdiL (CAAX protease family)
MPQWATFAGFAFVVTAGLLLLSHATRGVLDERDESTTADGAPAGGSDAEHETITFPKSGIEYRVVERERRRDGPLDAGADTIDDGSDNNSADHGVSETDTTANSASPTHPSPTDSPPDLSTASLLANVAVSQGLFGALLLAGAWYAEIPARAFGVGPDVVGVEAVALGIGLGVALYVANEAGAAVGGRFDLGDGERLRSALAPETPLGWATLLLVVLPVIAGFEELLFRGALIGVLAVGFDVSPWALAVVSSGAFALGHGAQGRLGVLVTGALGFVLAAAFVLTGSLLAVVMAHYLVNALEFVVHEGLGIEWSQN